MKLCKDCALFIHINAQCGRSRTKPDYVFGTTTGTFRAQTEREFDVEDGCGPFAKFFLPIVPAIDYAETMVKRDQLARHTGTPEHDTDVVGRALKAGM
jgi:hypothetical protein